MATKDRIEYDFELLGDAGNISGGTCSKKIIDNG
jgi:hypothetical protein